MAATARALRSRFRTFIGVACLSAIVNLLHLTGSVFMLEVYDRVLPSRSIPTLAGLAAIVVALYAFQGLFDILRGRILSRVGVALDESMSVLLFRRTLLQTLSGKHDDGAQPPLRDLDQVKSFLSGSGPSALFDLPWMPIYIFVCYAFHPVLGLSALAGAGLLVLVTLVTELSSRRTMRACSKAQQDRNAIASGGHRNAEVIKAMGMASRLGARWSQSNQAFVALQLRLSDTTGGFGSVSKVIRLLVQSGVLAVGAYLVIAGEITAGVMIASSILVSRALAPVELAIANWRSFLSARQSWTRLKSIAAENAHVVAPMQLPAPRRSFALESVSGAAPGATRPVIEGVSLSLSAGDGLGIIGPSAAGKSSLAKMIVGVWPNASGKVRLDGATLDHWSEESLGRHIGYLPQDVELFAGTVAENISRFEADAPPERVLAAAEAANIHDMILRFPAGYDTQIGEGGAALSGGQRQRIALARALYGDPFLVVLDEPNSNLDNDGDVALTDALLSVRARGGIVIVVAHRPSALAGVDQVLVMANGRTQAIGPKDEIIGKFMRQVPRGPTVLPFGAVASGSRQ